MRGGQGRRLQLQLRNGVQSCDTKAPLACAQHPKILTRFDNSATKARLRLQNTKMYQRSNYHSSSSAPDSKAPPLAFASDVIGCVQSGKPRAMLLVYILFAGRRTSEISQRSQAASSVV